MKHARNSKATDKTKNKKDSKQNELTPIQLSYVCYFMYVHMMSVNEP